MCDLLLLWFLEFIIAAENKAWEIVLAVCQISQWLPLSLFACLSRKECLLSLRSVLVDATKGTAVVLSPVLWDYPIGHLYSGGRIFQEHHLLLLGGVSHCWQIWPTLSINLIIVGAGPEFLLLWHFFRTGISFNRSPIVVVIVVARSLPLEGLTWLVIASSWCTVDYLIIQTEWPISEYLFTASTLSWMQLLLPETITLRDGNIIRIEARLNKWWLLT